MSDTAVISLPFGPNRHLHYLAEYLPHVIQIGSAKVTAFRHRFIDRRFAEDDPRPTLWVPMSGQKRSWEWHGCLIASIAILHQTMCQHLRYDDEADIVVAPKQLAQRFATQYGVDVNDMMQQYSAVRFAIMIPGVDVPEDIGVAIRNLHIAGEAEVRKEGL